MTGLKTVVGAGVSTNSGVVGLVSWRVVVGLRKEDGVVNRLKEAGVVN